MLLVLYRESFLLEEGVVVGDLQYGIDLSTDENVQWYLVFSTKLFVWDCLQDCSGSSVDTSECPVVLAGYSDVVCVEERTLVPMVVGSHGGQNILYILYIMYVLYNFCFAQAFRKSLN